MNEKQRTPRTAVDALHVELLGSILELVQEVERLKTDIPTIAADVEATKSAIAESIDEFKASAISLVGYVKQKQLETLGALHKSEAEVQTSNKKILAGFERWLWVIAAVAGINTLLLLVLLLKR
ncbi:hypothetical protein [Delftia sp. GW456-R20]|uniref:hypothetical protein n=1 Tax=Delftia sp. GW456-R20 TaxID=1827145 RepID=UPI000B1D6E2C|nr:hypothetical protein [Delftia sp. GW456-R20]